MFACRWAKESYNSTHLALTEQVEDVKTDTEDDGESDNDDDPPQATVKGETERHLGGKVGVSCWNAWH